MTDTQIQSALNAISSLQLSVADLNAQVGSLSSQVHAQGGTVTPQGQAITGATGTVQSETNARAAADAAIGRRWTCSPQGAAAHAKSALTTRIANTEEPALSVDPGQAVEPLRLGKVTFYGESARVIRDAQAVLESAGAGQLEVVKRAKEAGKPFAVVDGQVFISTADILKAAIDPARFEVKLRENSQGQYFAAGVGVGVQPEKPRVIIAQELLDEIQKQISESSLGKNLSNLEDRLNAVELSRVTQKGLDEATAARFGQQIDALQAQVDLLQVNVNSRG